jgi:peptidoglycan/LPS O-acetylase OafA/YrhL
VTAAEGVTAGPIEPAPRPESNNFDVLRLVFAALVIASHAFGLTGHTEPALWGRTLGNVGVHGFFVISGYLVSQSYLRSRTLAEYAGGRALRIVPGLVVAVVLATVAAAVFHQYVANPIPGLIDGPLWTLTWEAVCYGLVAVLGIIGVLNSTAFPAFLAAAWVVYLVNISSVSDFVLVIVPLLLMFGAGALMAAHPLPGADSYLPIIGGIGLVITFSYPLFTWLLWPVQQFVPFVFGPTITAGEVLRVVYLVSFPLVVIWLGRLSRPGIRLRNDLSYGSYIYGWPVGQMAVAIGIQFHVPLEPWWVLLVTIAATIPLAYLSWRFIERPALRLKRRFRSHPDPAW